MKTQRLFNQSNTITDFKMPSVRDVQFPKMKNRQSLNEIKVQKKFMLNIQLKQKPLEPLKNNVTRSFSFSVLNSKKNVSLTLSPVKAPINPQRYQLKFLRTRKPDNPFLQKCIIKGPYQTISNKERGQQDRLLKTQRHRQKQPNISSQSRRYHPLIKFQTIQTKQKRNQLLNRLLPNLSQKMTTTVNFLQDIKSARINKKKPLFNGKHITSKKFKQQLPDELITRKLIWQGKQVRRIDHYQIHKDLIQKSKIQKLNSEQLQTQYVKQMNQNILEFNLLNGWDDQQSKYYQKMVNR